MNITMDITTYGMTPEFTVIGEKRRSLNLTMSKN